MTGILNGMFQIHHPVKIHPKSPIPVLVSIPIYQKFEENNLEIGLCIHEQYNNKFLAFK